ncbi:hypothetical protein Ais01nite_51460 [Asanoa ishikariensis]|nr:hypothetical protein Ais01nite_51460 [Asanoa ishikariensis]
MTTGRKATATVAGGPARTAAGKPLARTAPTAGPNLAAAGGDSLPTGTRIATATTRTTAAKYNGALRSAYRLMHGSLVAAGASGNAA